MGKDDPKDHLRRAITKHVKTILLSPRQAGEVHARLLPGMIYRKIPADISSAYDSNEYSIILDGKGAEAYVSVVDAVRQYTPAEDLSIDEVEEEVWRMVCEVVLRRKEAVRDNEVLDSLVAGCVDRVTSPLEEFEFIFELLVTPKPFPSFVLSDVAFAHMTRDELLAKGIDERHLRDLDAMCVAITNEQGVTAKIAEVRARRRVISATEQLTFITAFSLVLHDWQRVYRLGSHTFVRRERDGKTGIALHRIEVPRPNFMQTIDDRSFAEATGALSAYSACSESIRLAVNRALHWFARATESLDDDSKVLAICTALESILTSRSDKRKGEKLAFRSVALMFEFSKGTVWPGAILEIYEIRSRLVHGSDIKISSNDHYMTLRLVAKEVLVCFVAFASRNPKAKMSRLIERLDQCEGARSAAAWLEEHASTDESVEKILKSLSSSS